MLCLAQRNGDEGMTTRSADMVGALRAELRPYEDGTILDVWVGPRGATRSIKDERVAEIKREIANAEKWASRTLRP
jgi:hypothetical protein